MNALTFKEVYDFILDNKLYRDPTLSPTRLSHQLNMSTEKLHTLFETFCGQDFSCFINELRVMEAKRMIEARCFSGFSIEAIGRMAGFNSKITFTTVFKEKTGRMPTDYKATVKYIH